ncbi:prepilin peptidase [Aquitalea palustris]|uniref:prepilin peptidase n=1 Tax=Aquitalea palustris TaxID=2480983 RepID=UPI001CEFBCAA|nr:prepilin peptidase [Aquitalea palustris]
MNWYVHWLSTDNTSLSVLCGLFGLLLGSFYNVVIYRLPIMVHRWKAGLRYADFNLSVPRSSCPSCGHQITPLENIPVLSWICLRGQCSSCSNRISARYPSVEAATAGASFLLAWTIHWGWVLGIALILSHMAMVVTLLAHDIRNKS